MMITTSYHRSYFSSNKVNVQELSVVFLRDDGSAIARLPLDLLTEGQVISLTSAGLDIFAPCFVRGIKEKEQKKLSGNLARAILDLGKVLNLNKVVFDVSPCISGYAMSTLSFWQLALLKSGCRTQFRNSFSVRSIKRSI